MLGGMIVSVVNVVVKLKSEMCGMGDLYFFVKCAGGWADKSDVEAVKRWLLL